MDDERGDERGVRGSGVARKDGGERRTRGGAGGERGAIEVGGLEEADARGQTYECATARTERHVREE